MDRTGQQLGNYRLIRLLGQGGFAEVYLGEHTHLNTLAAVKVFDTRLSESQVSDFYFETNMLAQLIHPHIMPVLDSGVDDDRTPYLIMGYAANGTLRQKHPKGSKLPLSTIIPYVQQIAGALQYAHEKKVLHRDIRPENMLLDEHSQVLLSDFSIPLVSQMLKVDGIDYLAPEQLQGEPSPVSDQYALGIVVYEWLSGERPFEIYDQHSFIPPSLHAKLPELPSDVEDMVFTALAKDPEKRFSSVLVFATALEQANKQSSWQRPNTPISSPMAPHSGSPPHPAVYGGSHPNPQIQTTLSYGPSRHDLLDPIKHYVLPFLSGLLQKATSNTLSIVRRDARKKTQIPLAIARTELEKDDRASVGKTYIIEAGIEQNKPVDTIGELFPLLGKSRTTPIQFDLVLHTSDIIEATETWHKRLSYEPHRTGIQAVTFPFRFTAPGRGTLAINFYGEQRWLKTIRFDIETIEHSVSQAVQ